MAKDYYDLDIYSDKKPKKNKKESKGKRGIANKLSKEKKLDKDDFEIEQDTPSNKVRKVSKFQIAMTVVMIICLIAKIADKGHKNTVNTKPEESAEIAKPVDREIDYYFNGGTFTYDGMALNLDANTGFLSPNATDSVEFSEFNFNGGYDGLEIMLNTKERTANNIKDAVVTKCDTFDEVKNCGNYTITYYTPKGISTECIFWDNNIENSLLNTAYLIKIQSNIDTGHKVTTDDTDAYNEELIKILQSVQFDDLSDGYVEAYP